MKKNRRILISIMCGILALLMIVTLLTGVIGSLGASAASQAEVDELRARKKEITAQKNELSDTIESLKGQQDQLIVQKEALDRQVNLTYEEITLIERQLEIYEQLLAIKQLDYEEAQEQADEQLERYRARTRKLEEMGEVSIFAVIFKATSFTELLSRIDSVKEIIEADRELENAYITAKKNAALVKAEYEASKVETEASKAELEAAKLELEAEIAEAESFISGLDTEIAEYLEMFAQADAEAAAVDADITAMLAEIKRQEEEAKRLAELAKQEAALVVGTGELLWPCPSSNKLTSPFGDRSSPGGVGSTNHKGIDIGASTGSPIVAADDGTVVTATYSSSYGNYVIINHGNGRATLYAHQSAIACKVGQVVVKGMVIGYVGSTGISTGPHLHFEVRENGVAVNPLNYFSSSQYVRYY